MCYLLSPSAASAGWEACRCTADDRMPTLRLWTYPGRQISAWSRLSRAAWCLPCLAYTANLACGRGGQACL